jgi:peptidoglycan/LPS O-acetylase OafA/YrhL
MTFWARRVRRIVPALLAVCIVTAIAAWFILLPDAHAVFGTALIRVVAMVSNLQFNRHTGYFSPAAERIPLLHTWSLAVEEQFYLVVPLLVWLGLAKSGRSGRALSITFVVLLAISLIVSIVEVRRHPNSAFFLIQSRAWELLAGGLLAMAPAVARAKRAWWLQMMALTGLAFILTAFFTFDDDTRFPGESALLPVLGAVLVIWSGGAEGRATIVSRCLASRIPVAIGLISYSLYLWHWPLLAFARAASPAALTLTVRITLAVAALLIAWLSYLYIEQPFRTRRLLSRRAGFSLAMFASAAVLVGWGATLGLRQGFPSRLPESALRFADDAIVDERWSRNTEVRDFPDRVVRIGDPTEPARVLVWGDSHAMAILPAIEALCADEQQSAFVIAHSSTAPLLDFMTRKKHGLGERAPEFSRAALEFITLKQVRVVILAALWAEYREFPNFDASLESTVKALTERGVQVYFLADVPRFPADVPSTLTLCAWNGRTPQLGYSLDKYARDNGYLIELAPVFTSFGVIVLDPSTYLPAARGLIMPFDGEGAWFRDSHHLSTRGALRMKRLFAPMFVL